MWYCFVKFITLFNCFYLNRLGIRVCETGVGKYTSYLLVCRQSSRSKEKDVFMLVSVRNKTKGAQFNNPDVDSCKKSLFSGIFQFSTTALGQKKPQTKKKQQKELNWTEKKTTISLENWKNPPKRRMDFQPVREKRHQINS